MTFRFEQWRICEVFPSTFELQVMGPTGTRTEAQFNSHTAAVAELTRSILRINADSSKVKSLWKKYVASIQEETASRYACKEV